MMPVLLRLGPITVYSYGLMMALGFIAADLVCSSQFKHRGLPAEQASMLVLWTAVAGIAGARIYDILDNWSRYAAHPSSMIFSGAGFVWYGGLIGGTLASVAFARFRHIPWRIVADCAAPALAIGHAIGRIGCQLSGDGDWGTVSKLPWAMAYPNAIVGWNGQTVLRVNSHNQLVSAYFPGVRVHPAPVYETILYTIVFFVLLRLGRKSRPIGQLFYIYLILAGACRFLVEFIRVNPRVLLGLSEAQLIALMMIAIGLVAYGWSSTTKQPLTALEAA